MNRSECAAPRCPGTLSEDYTTYCPAVIRSVFKGKRVFHVLDQSFPKEDWKSAQLTGAKYGGQLWFGMKLLKNKLIPDPSGEYVLKTVVQGGSQLRFHMEQPGNAHICFQLASQVFGLPAVPNAMIFFRDGQPAVIQQRFSNADAYTPFAELDSASRAITSFTDIAALIEHHCAAPLIVMERFFSQVVFWWMVANGLEYTKNAGLIKTARGDFDIAPLNHVMCTRIHELSPELRMKNGLYPGDKATPEFQENGHYTRNEFMSFGIRIGLQSRRIIKLLDRFAAGRAHAETLIEKSFLPADAKAVIRFNVLENLMRLK